MDSQQMSLKKIAIIILAAIMSGWLIFFYASQPTSAPRSEAFRDVVPAKNAPVGNKETAADNAAAPTVSDLNKQAYGQRATDSTEIRTVSGTPAEAEVVRKWKEARGTFSLDALADYASYDIDTLKRLVDAGDVKAMSVLAEKYLTEPYVEQYGLDHALPLLTLASAHGSTDALGFLASIYRPQVRSARYEKGSQHSVLLESLAWSNAAALRGDKMPNHHAYLDMKAAKIELSVHDKSWVAQRSEEIYDEVLTHRRSLGLGDFDNTVPPEVENYFSYLEDYMNQKPIN